MIKSQSIINAKPIFNNSHQKLTKNSKKFKTFQKNKKKIKKFFKKLLTRRYLGVIIYIVIVLSNFDKTIKYRGGKVC